MSTELPTKLAGVEIKNVSELPEWGVCIAIYGPPGVGKTTLAAKLALSPYGSPLLILDAEGGVRSVTHLPNTQSVEIKDWGMLSTLSRTIIQMRDECPWKTVVIDNMSEIQAMHMRSIVPVGNPEIQHWNANTGALLKFTRDWRDFARFFSVNVIFCAWAAPEKDELNQIIKADVGFSPSLARQFPGIVDIVGYLTVSGTSDIRVLSFAASTRTAAKFRRSGGENATKIPLTIRYNESHNPLGDVVATLRGGEPWPINKYSLRTKEEDKDKEKEKES